MDMNMPIAPIGTSSMSGFGGENNLLIFILFFLFFGRDGLGGNTQGRALEQGYISNEFNFSTLDNGIRGLERGLCDLGYSTAQQFNGTNTAILQSAYGTERAVSALGTQFAQCCCETNRNIDSVKYEMSKGFCDVITNANMNTRDLLEAGYRNTKEIVDALKDKQILDLRDANGALTLQVSQSAQTQAIISALGK